MAGSIKNGDGEASHLFRSPFFTKTSCKQDKMTQILKLKILNSLIWNICERKIEENNGNYFRPGRKSVSEIARPRLISVLDPKRYYPSANIEKQQILMNNKYQWTTDISTSICPRTKTVLSLHKYWWTKNTGQEQVLANNKH